MKELIKKILKEQQDNDWDWVREIPDSITKETDISYFLKVPLYWMKDADTPEISETVKDGLYYLEHLTNGHVDLCWFCIKDNRVKCWDYKLPHIVNLFELGKLQFKYNIDNK